MKTRTAHGQRTLSTEYFTSPQLFAEEREKIFRNRWLYAGHVSQVEKPGDFFLFELDHESVIVIRDQQGELKAHHNFCRHRGTRLCMESHGSTAAGIQCPYHAWTYNLDGSLRAAPNMTDVEGFEKSEFPLIGAQLAERDGLLFVHLGRTSGERPQTLGEQFPTLPGKFERWKIEELRSVHQTIYEVEANWKLFFHNYSECYHCPNVHPHLNKLTPYKNTRNDLDEGPILGGQMWMTNPDGSMTTGGGRCAPLLPGLNDTDRGHVFYYTLFPSMFLSLHPDYVLIHRAQSVGPTSTRIFCDWFFHPEAIAAPGFDPQPAIEFWDLTNRQDWELCANAQIGVSSRAYVPGPYAEIESQLAAFDREYLAAMGREGRPPLAVAR